MKKGIHVQHKEYGKGRVVGFLEDGTPRVRFNAKTIVALPKEELKIVMTRYFAPVKDAPEDTKLPVRGTLRSAGYDIYAAEDIYCPAHGISKLSFTNIKVAMKTNEYLAIVIRSSLAIKFGLQVAQGFSVIDADYFSNPTNDGNVGVAIVNNSDNDYTIKKGERFCQGIFHQYFTTDDDEAVGERVGGYGSTDK